MIAENFLSDPQQLNLYSYARNNPITLSDPTGLLTMQDVGYFALGMGNAYFSNNLGGFRRGDYPNSYYTAGQGIGDKLALAQGAAEINAAINAGIISNMAGAALALPTGGMSLGGAIAIDATGAAVITHGLGVSGIASYYLSKGQGSGKDIRTPGAINQEKYLSVGKDKGYIDYIKNIYRKEATIGDGGTADYFRLHGDEGHAIKMQERITQGERLLQNGRLTAEEAQNVQNINLDMKNALSNFKKQ